MDQATPYMVQTTDNRAPDTSAADQSAILAERARNGDAIAFERLVNLYQEEVFRMVYYRIRSRMDAEDLTQDVFLQAYRGLGSLKETDRFRPWLFRIALNRVRDYLRHKKFLSFFGFASLDGDPPEEGETDLVHSPGVLDDLMRREFWEKVNALSTLLSPVEREVFFLRFMDDLNLKEISQVLKKSESAVKTHLYRALKKYRDDATLAEMLEGGVQ